jgi:hypothetical protein
MSKAVISRKPIETRGRLATARRIAGAALVVAAATFVSSCAGGPAAFDRGLSADAGSDAWEGAAKPKPASYSATVRAGSMPLLPPVPEPTNALPPIKLTAFAD